MYATKGDHTTKFVGTLNNNANNDISIPSCNNKRKIDQINSNSNTPAKRQKIVEGKNYQSQTFLKRVVTAGTSSSPQRIIIHTAGLYIRNIINERAQIKLEWSWIAYEVNSREEVWFAVHKISNNIVC